MSMRRIDVNDLPAEVVALIDGLGSDEDLVVTRDGRSIATIDRTYGFFDPGARTDDGEQPPYDGVTVVATAMELPDEVRAALSTGLGADYIVLDLHKAPASTDVLLVPPVSPQLIGHLRSMFPKARVVVAEIDDPSLGVSFRGPIGRLIDAGADTYLASTTIPNLATQLDRAVNQPQLTEAAPETLEITEAP
ncbi:hypothetical protein GCM10029964_028530 [Kibdelosporangium lantanae]